MPRWSLGRRSCTSCGRPSVKWLLALALLLPGFAPAQTTTRNVTQHTWTIDPAQSQVTFAVRKFWFVHVRGTFQALSGTLHRLDTRIGVNLGQVDAALDASGLHMDDQDARARALGAGFFDVAQYPHIAFESDAFALEELVSGGALRGVLTLHGESRPVALALQPSGCPREPLTCVIRVRGTISRSAFGMRDMRAVLSDKVELDLEIVLRSSPHAALPDPRPDAGRPAS